jgi:predicted dienelactone hydrolase
MILIVLTGCRLGRGNNQNPGTQATQTSVPVAAGLTSTPGPEGMYITPVTYKVGVFDNYQVHDAERSRTFPILIRYPVGAPGPLPLIIWSHGGGYSDNGHHQNNEWGTVLASAGYAVIHIAHVTAEPGAHCAALQIPADECEDSDFTTEVRAGGTIGSPWYNKPLDGIAVLNDLENIERAANLTFDRDRIGAAGWSGGTVMVMGMAGSVRDVSPSVHNFMSFDPRVKAFLANSPQGIGAIGYTETSWDGITGPVLIATGKADTTPNEQAPSRLDSFEHMPAPDKYLLYIDSPDANHTTFGLGPDGAQELQPYVAAAALAFFDAYLRGYPEALAWLNSNSVSIWSSGVAEISAKH